MCHIKGCKNDETSPKESGILFVVPCKLSCSRPAPDTSSLLLISFPGIINPRVGLNHKLEHG